MKKSINTNKQHNFSLMRIIAVFMCALMITVLAQPLTAAQAAGARLSTRTTDIWLNGKGTVSFTLADRQTDETIKVTPEDKSLVAVKIGKWKKNKVNVAFTPRTDATTKVTVSCGDESITLTLHMKKQKAMTSEEVYSYLHDATVEIKTWDSKGNVYIGAGFFVGSGEVLTVHHVVSSASKITIKGYDGKEYKVKSVLGLSEKDDLILLKTGTGNKNALSTATEIKGGMRMYAFGSPAGVSGTFSTGIVSNPYIEMDGGEFFQSTMPSGIGSGGGPMVNEYGQLLGVMSLTVKVAQNLNFGIRYDVVKNFLNGITSSSAMTMKEFYKTTAGKVKDTNDYGIFDNTSDVVDNASFEDVFKELTSEEIYELAHDAMADILVAFGGTSGASGSGFFIDEETVVTCAHVISGGTPALIKVTDYNGNVYMADLSKTRMNEDYDVALLTVKPQEVKSKHTVLQMAPGYLPACGETVYAFGSPSGYSCTLSDGITILPTASLSKIESAGLGVAEDLKFITFSAPIFSGSSGGVLMNKYGFAVGITSGIINVTENLNMAIQIDQISKIR